MDGDLRVPVATEAELLDHLGKGWKLYFHKTVRRWYVYRGARDRKIVSASLENLCEKLYRELSGGREPVLALEVQERRWQGELIEGIASDMGLSRGAVYNALEKIPVIVKPREKPRGVATEETAPEGAAEADRAKDGYKDHSKEGMALRPEELEDIVTALRELGMSYDETVKLMSEVTKDAKSLRPFGETWC
jgi:DNA-binding transcriptional regulator YhcF (GntR family)